MDADFESKVKHCLICQRSRKKPPKVPIQPWDWPEKPWSRIHVDHTGPILGKTLLIIVDAYSKWIEVHIVPSTTSSAAIEKPQVTFTTHGLPKTLVSDYGPAFVSREFEEFMRRNGIKHLTTAPYHPSNSLAERAVQAVKDGLERMTGPLETRLPRFLLKYRVTPQATTGIAPTELLMGRRIRTHLDLLYLTTRQRVREHQMQQKKVVIQMHTHKSSTQVIESWAETLLMNQSSFLGRCWREEK